MPTVIANAYCKFSGRGEIPHRRYV